MEYSISKVANIMNTTSSTLRYYDKNGLLPFVDRDSNGRRLFKENDLNFIQVIMCMKKSGLKIKEIRNFISLCMSGDSTLEDRYTFLNKEEQNLTAKIKELEDQRDFLRYKKWYYKTSLDAGTEKIHFLPDSMQVKPNTRAEYEKKLTQCSNIEDLINYKAK